MDILLSHTTAQLAGQIKLTASKSESNRALIVQALCGEDFVIDNLAEAEDTNVLKNLLNLIETGNTTLDVGLAGTAMRFLTAYLAITPGDWLLTGADRMKQRPIKVLVEALQKIGADIKYIEEEGYPPLKIKGKELVGGILTIDGSVSSQYISALLMIAPRLKQGLKICFEGELISQPYLKMTTEMMAHFGVNVNWFDEGVEVAKSQYKAKNFTVEADWSAASYWYGVVALSKEASITLYGLKKESLQGDSAVTGVYRKMGVETTFIDGGIKLTKNAEVNFKVLELDFTDCPDIAQTVAVTCAALSVNARFTGLKTLRIKETDRISALQNELSKLGFSVEVEKDDILIFPSLQKKSIEIKRVMTYDDHRMAMSFAPLALFKPIKIEDADVVKKSYPNFWKDLSLVGFSID